jgi:hypothetical protein
LAFLPPVCFQNSLSVYFLVPPSHFPATLSVASTHLHSFVLVYRIFLMIHIFIKFSFDYLLPLKCMCCDFISLFSIFIRVY